MAGAIPVVIAGSEEIKKEFAFNGDSPVSFFVYASNPAAALDLCQKMPHEEVNRRRSELINWYIRKFEFITNLAVKSLDDSAAADAVRLNRTSVAPAMKPTITTVNGTHETEIVKPQVNGGNGTDTNRTATG